jgi:GABA(A) receptor-associated protein
MSGFQSSNGFEERLSESTKIIEKYPDRVPIIVERSLDCNNIPQIDKKKYLVPNDLTVGQFIYIIRKRISLEPDKAIFIFVKNNLPAPARDIVEIYKEYKDEDGFLYVTYSGENTFGK